MIVRPRQNWLRMLFIWNGSVLREIIPQLGFILLVSVLALYTGGRVLGDKVPLNTAPFTLMGVTLAIFLAFRNNASYDRYWEARKLWGKLLIAARSLTSQVVNYAPPEHAGLDRQAFAAGLIAFAHALNHQLRGTDAQAAVAPWLPPEDAAAFPARSYPTIFLLDRLRARLAQARRDGALTDTQLWMCDAQLNALSDVVGGCERIAATPIPFPYGVLLHRTVYMYCMLLPFGLVDSIGLATPLISVFLSYTLLALEAIASEIADPFGTAPNHLALDAMTRTLERSVLELSGARVPAEAAVGRRYQLT